MSDDRRCVAASCCDNRPGWAYDATTGRRERLPAQPGQHGTEDHQCRPRMAQDAAYLCPGCERLLRSLIQEMPSYATDLQKAVTHSAGRASVDQRDNSRASEDWGRPPARQGKSGEASPDFPGPRKRYEALTQLAHDVAWWVRMVADERGMTHPVMNTEAQPVLAVWRGCRWLDKHSPWLAARPSADETLAVWRQIRSDAAHAMDLPRDRAQFPIGPCPEDCPGTVVVFIGTEANDSAMHCTALPDEHKWGTAQFYRAGKRIRQKTEGAA